MLDVVSILFYVIATTMCLSGLLVITLRQPVYAIMFLVKTIVCAAILWMMMSAEFLSLALIFVYVGAVMTLFLFVAMMLNVTTVRDPFWKSAMTWLGVLVSAGVIYLLARAFVHAQWAHIIPIQIHYGLSNVERIGHVLYSEYVLPVELASVLLLAAMISAVALTLKGESSQGKRQKIGDQTTVIAKDRLQMVDLREEGTSK